MAVAPAVVPPALSIPRPRRWLRWLTRAGMSVAGLAVGLIAAELVFRFRDGGAFPHLNVYVADAELGVRLAPGASQNISFGGNPITSVRINGAGLRGGELAPPAAGEVLVVGDSQVFGLGVEEGETFSARLHELARRPVVNAGVPTYGPDEYRAMIVEQLAARRPGTVVLTLNLVNDLFEVNRPNRDRHAVWDGWAVRSETAPDETTWFPGRDFVYRRSHLFFALRKWWHAADRLDERGFASEGSWRDLIAAGQRLRDERARAESRLRERAAGLARTQQELASSEQQIDETIERVLRESAFYDVHVLARARAHPGDIVAEDFYAESGRRIMITAEQIREATAARARLRAELAAWARRRTGDGAKRALDTLAAREQLIAQLGELDAQKLRAALDPPLAGYLRDVHELVGAAGARLVVLILPIDVQVSPGEWAKYGAAPIDMAPTTALTAELVELCSSLGVTAVDATPVLAAVQPGAFLDKDIHMTPKGHAAVAAALATALAAAPPRPPVISDRSPVPVPGLWKQAPEVVVTGSTAAGCETKQIREWLRVICVRTEESPAALRVDIERDDGGETLALTTPHGVSLVIPVVAGRDFVARLTWPDRTRVLRVSWPREQARPAMAFDKPVKLSPPVALAPGEDGFASDDIAQICDCWNRLHAGGGIGVVRAACSGAYGTADPACVARYKPTTGGDDALLASCEQLLACIRRDPAAPP